MGRRGIVPLLLATAFGVANGVWAFGPALKERRAAVIDQEQEALEARSQEVQGGDKMKMPNNTGPMASDSTVNESSLESKEISKEISKPGWPRISLWAEPPVDVTKRGPPSNNSQSNSENRGP